LHAIHRVVPFSMNLNNQISPRQAIIRRRISQKRYKTYNSNRINIKNLYKRHILNSVNSNNRIPHTSGNTISEIKFTQAYVTFTITVSRFTAINDLIIMRAVLATAELLVCFRQRLARVIQTGCNA